MANPGKTIFIAFASMILVFCMFSLYPVWTKENPIPKTDALIPEGEFFKNPKDGTLLKLIPEGEFIAGGDGFDEGKGAFSLRLPAFYMAVYPVTNRQYKQFTDETGYKPPVGDVWEGNSFPDEKADHPVVYVNWDDASAYCKWAGLRLPTELEWEKSARGIDGREFPWGNKWDDNLCRNYYNKGNETTCPVGEYPEGRSPWGLYNMSGNVWEWCAEWYDEDAYNRYKKSDLTVPEKGIYRVIRGGSWYCSSRDTFRCAGRNFNTAPRGGSGSPGYPDGFGFRCARDY